MSDNSSSPTKIIAIVGAGFSGALTSVNVLRQNPGAALRIILVDRGTRPGRGLAYGTWDDNFLLNVPAGNMSALADDSGHFVRFCQHIDPAFNSATFALRRLYGDYLELTLRQETQSLFDSNLAITLIKSILRMDGASAPTRLFSHSAIFLR